MPGVNLWKFADKITQVCNCLLIKYPKKRKDEVNGGVVFYSRGRTDLDKHLGLITMKSRIQRISH